MIYPVIKLYFISNYIFNLILFLESSNLRICFPQIHKIVILVQHLHLAVCTWICLPSGIFTEMQAILFRCADDAFVNYCTNISLLLTTKIKSNQLNGDHFGMSLWFIMIWCLSLSMYTLAADVSTLPCVESFSGSFPSVQEIKWKIYLN